MKSVMLSIVPVLMLALACSEKRTGSNLPGWAVYGGSKENTHFSGAAQIDSSNVHLLERAWIYRTGDADDNSQIQVNPLIVDGILYGISPKLKLFALDAATGKEHWVYDPVKDFTGRKEEFQFNISRGLAIYQSGSEKLLFYSANSHLYCINAHTGKPVNSFGKAGRVDLREGLDRDASDLYVAGTSPGIIYQDLIIIGARVAEESRAAPGHIRAYDVHTGKRRWIFHTIPQPGQPGYETWQDSLAYRYIGGANAWAGFSLDENRGIVYVPTGSAVYDFYGGRRIGNNLYANCILALDALTGEYRWHYQTIHHDVWDRDLPTAPLLLTLEKDGKKTDAVAQVTKTGYTFLLDRETGEPLYPVVEDAVPVNSDLIGEVLSPTQPKPSFPEPFIRQHITEKDLNTLISPASQDSIKKKFSLIRRDHMFEPPSKQGTLIFPGFDGGAEWGGPAYDSSTGLLYVNANEMPWILTMIDNKAESKKEETVWEAGRRIYNGPCIACHGSDRKGSGNYPSLLNIEKRMTEPELISLLGSGRRMMPSFNYLSEPEKKAVAAYLSGRRTNEPFEADHSAEAGDAYYNLPYVATGYHKFLTPEGYPAVSPPWGTINAIDLSTGKIVWKKPLGEYPELKKKGMETGTENYGGPVVTAGGILFIAASSDSRIRAFNKRTGEKLWEASLPAPGFATPSVYMSNGKQYLVIACGGGKLGKKGYDAYVAFALPD